MVQPAPSARGIPAGDLAGTRQFSAFLDAYANAAAAAGGEIVRGFTVAGFSIRMRFAGDALVGPMTRALAHLGSVPPRAPDLTICLWDSATTGVDLPPGIGSMNTHFRQSLPASTTEGGIYSALQLPHSGLSMLDLQRNTAVFAVSDPACLPFWDFTAPLRAILNWWMASRGLQLVHAAAVGLDTGAVLLAGKGGSGKSTTAIASLLSGLKYAGDDYCLVANEPGPCVHSLYSSGKVAADGLERLGQLRPFVSNPEKLPAEKAIFWLYEAFPGSIVSHLPVVAILFPRFRGASQPAMRPMPKASALAALAPSSLLQLPGAGADGLKRLSQLVSSLPCYTLELSDDPLQAARLIREFLETRGTS
jgi:hypothetical protein